MQKSKHFFLVIIILFLSSFSGLNAQNIPDPMQPPRLVNDFAGILSSNEVDRLENKLVAFNDYTSTQIAVVIVKSLNGYDKNDFAQRLGQKWGVGQKGKNNGIIILVKPKYPKEQGEVSIQTGYGMEGVLPDKTCKMIVEDEMIPLFSEGNYYGGIDAAVSAIISVIKGIYPSYQYKKKNQYNNEQPEPYWILIPVILLLVFFIVRINSIRSHTIGKDISLWTAICLFISMGNRRHKGSWGKFQSGDGGYNVGGGFIGGGFGGSGFIGGTSAGGGGSFGGFGGGSFGGGGAGGRW